MIGPDDPRYSWTRQQMLEEIERQEAEIERLSTLESSHGDVQKNKKRLLKAQCLILKVMNDM